MAYTASTLSFILENLNKSVIVTGSQIPILELKNDAVDNFLASLLFACQYSIPEVMICFGNKLIRGNRSRKTSSNQLIAFTSPNFGYLAEVGVNFLVHWERILGHSYFGEFNVFKELNDEIATFHCAPILNIKQAEATFKDNKAVIIMGFGMGNLPTNHSAFM